MSVTENHEMLENGASTAVEEHNETMAAEPGAGVHEQDETQVPPLGLKSSAGTSDSGEKRTANSEERPANVKLCLHVKEDGVFCHCPALGGRQYCYRHLRLRGQQMRMARAIAQRQPYHLVLPPLEDMNAVQAALTHVTAALTAVCWSGAAPGCCSMLCNRRPAICASWPGPKPKPRPPSSQKRASSLPHPRRPSSSARWRHMPNSRPE